MSLRERFGPAIGRLRTAANLSQEKVAHRSGLHATFVGEVERGEKSVTLDTLESLARGLGLSPGHLVDLAMSGGMPVREATRRVERYKPSAGGTRTLRLSILVERTHEGYSATCPDLPECVAKANTRDHAETELLRVITQHLQALVVAGKLIPTPVTAATIVEVTY